MMSASGVLYACKLVHSVNDWDITTDHPLSETVEALGAENWILKRKTELFDSEYVIQLPDYNTDVIGSFRINSPTGICEIPNYISTWWDGEIPLASPEAWFVAYRLMGRDEKANLLRRFIETNGAEQNVALAVLAQPLPHDVKTESEVLFGI
jgi:hypothetical protein